MATEYVVVLVVLRRPRMTLVMRLKAINRFKFTKDYERKKVLVEAEFMPEGAAVLRNRAHRLDSLRSVRHRELQRSAC